MIMWVYFLCAFLLSFFLTYLIRHYTLAKNLIDIPNARSSHTMPTPRGGGLSVVIICLASLLLLTFIAVDPVMLGIFFAGLCVAGIGFWDDHHHIPARWRLLVHSLAALLVLMSLSDLPTITLFQLSFSANGFSSLLYGIALVWLLNLYNFMDGIDGIASTETITVAFSAAAILAMRGEFNHSLLLLLLASSVGGFLVWNWSPAKIFMGDVCSGFLGFMLGVSALTTSATGAITLWSWLILLGLFVTDATFTLIKRILNKEIWYEAHARHAYQRYARQRIDFFEQQGFLPTEARYKSHRHINFLIIVIHISWLFPLAIMATFYPFWAALITVIAYLPLLWIAHTLKAGHPQ